MEIEIKIAHTIDAEEIPLCPYCDQPIMSGAVVIKNVFYGNIGLAHGDCFTEHEEEV